MTINTKIGAMEARFAEIIWNNAPMTTRRMVELCQQELNWARTTTYTVLRKFCDKGIFNMENKMVTVLVSRDEFNAMRSEELVMDAFGGSLPAFFVAFGSRKKLSDKEVEELHKLIDDMRG